MEKGMVEEEMVRCAGDAMNMNLGKLKETGQRSLVCYGPCAMEL